MANKITKREMFTMIMAEVSANADMVAFLEHEIDLLDKKAANKKDTKKQVENDGIKATIVEVLENNPSVTVSELIKSDARLNDFSNQKLSALLRQLVDDNKVVKVVDKKVSRFSLV